MGLGPKVEFNWIEVLDTCKVIHYEVDVPLP